MARVMGLLRNNLEKIRAEMSAERGSVISQREFAKFLGVSHTLYNRWANQRGQPSRENLIKLSARLKRPITDIVYESSE